MLSETRWLTIDTLRSLVGEMGAPLQVLNLDSCFMVPGRSLLQLRGVGNFDALTDLNIASLTGVDDSFVAALTDGMTELKTLNLSCTRVTGCTIKLFADHRERGEKPSIERLYAKYCEDVSSDAVAYGRARGIEVFT